MQRTFLAGEQDAGAIIESHSKISFQASVIRQSRFPAMLDKRLCRLQTTLQSADSNGPVLQVNVREEEWRNRCTIFPWKSRSTAGTLTHSKTVVKRECQNTPGAWISFAREFKQFLDLIPFKVYAAIDFKRVFPLVEDHPRVAWLRVPLDIA